MRMQLRLRTKLTLVMSALVFIVVAVLSVVFLDQWLQQVLQEADDSAGYFAQNVIFVSLKTALTDSADRGLRPYSNSPEDIHDYVRHAVEIDQGLQEQLAHATYNPLISEVSITDDQGLVLTSTDPKLPGEFLA